VFDDINPDTVQSVRHGVFAVLVGVAVGLVAIVLGADGIAVLVVVFVVAVGTWLALGRLEKRLRTKRGAKSGGIVLSERLRTGISNRFKEAVRMRRQIEASNQTEPELAAWASETEDEIGRLDETGLSLSERFVDAEHHTKKRTPPDHLSQEAGADWEDLDVMARWLRWQLENPTRPS
jgi:hypothetical protein